MINGNEGKANASPQGFADMKERFGALPGTERVEKRTENAKHFDLGQGRYQMVVYPHMVHYQEAGYDACQCSYAC